MKIIGIETVTKIGSLSVVENGKVKANRIIDVKLNHAAGLISTLDDLLSSVDIGFSEIDIVGIDMGPGSFTGIRVGIASAEGLISFNKKQLIGVNSLEVLCYEIIKKDKCNKTKYLVPFIDAKRGGIYTGLYKFSDKEHIQVIKEPYLTKLEELVKVIPEDSLIFGPDINIFDESKPVFPTADTVALLAEKKIYNKEKLCEVKPMYLYDVDYRKS